MSLSPHIWVPATIKSLNSQMISTYLRHRGDDHRGLVAIVVDHLDGTATAYIQQRDFMTGDLSWNQKHSTPVSVLEVNEWVEKQLSFDADMWVLDVESSQSNKFDINRLF